MLPVLLWVPPAVCVSRMDSIIKTVLKEEGEHDSEFRLCTSFGWDRVTALCWVFRLKVCCAAWLAAGPSHEIFIGGGGDIYWGLLGIHRRPNPPTQKI